MCACTRAAWVSVQHHVEAKHTEGNLFSSAVYKPPNKKHIIQIHRINPCHDWPTLDITNHLWENINYSLPLALKCKDQRNSDPLRKFKLHILYSQIRGNNIVKMCIPPKDITDLMQSPSKFQWHFHINRTSNPQVSMKPQDSQWPKQHWERRTKLTASHSLTSNYGTKYSNQNSMVLT